MSCLSALENQVLTLLTSPKDILFLRHNVYREYGKIALGPDFIHTFPSFIIIISIGIVIRRYLRLDWLNLSNKIVRRIFQVSEKTKLFLFLIYMYFYFNQLKK